MDNVWIQFFSDMFKIDWITCPKQTWVPLRYRMSYVHKNDHVITVNKNDDHGIFEQKSGD